VIYNLPLVYREGDLQGTLRHIGIKPIIKITETIYKSLSVFHMFYYSIFFLLNSRVHFGRTPDFSNFLQ